MLGRRGPAQAKFTNPEIKELDELIDADILVSPEDVDLDPLSHEHMRESEDRSAEKNVQILMQYAQHEPQNRPKRIHMHFLVSPVEIIGTDHVEAVKVVKNELYQREDGSLRPRATDEYEIIPAGLVFRSIGYHGVALPDVPFDEWSGTIPNKRGRVIDPAGQRVIGEYAAGWIKRGPTGIIGTNKPDAHETVNLLVEDVGNGIYLHPSEPEREAVEALLAERQINHVTYDDWRIIDEIEQQRGQAVGRPRVKFCRVEDMLAALAEYKGEPIQGG
jgi:ferredoxin--NADP+ reductase